jgi:hypothetical protein
MSRKAPTILALFLGLGWLSTASAGGDVIGAIDTPTVNQKVSGVVRVSGFALDFNPIDKIEILVDGVLVNRADLNIPRADVLEVFPNYFNSPTQRPGFLSAFLARNYSSGLHSLTVRVTESSGAVTLLGPITVVVDNSVNQAPFGFIDIPSATVVEGASGSFPIQGWALDDEDIDHLDFLVDGLIVAGAVGRGRPGTANFGTTRPDVYAAFPDFPGPAPRSLYSGFIANVDTTRFLNGIHIFSVRATDNRGLSALIGTRTVQIENNGANLAPFGRIDFPLDKASILCTGTFTQSPGPGVCPSPCTPGPPTPGFPGLIPNIVKGWALDTGARLDKGQVAYVELLIDGAIIANTRRDCVLVGGTPTNCYGVNRPDVAALFPGYVNADNAGFNFIFALERDPGNGIFDILVPGLNGTQIVGAIVGGKHTLAVRVGDDAATVVQIGAMSFDVVCDVNTNDFPAIGFIDSPAVYQFINGIFTFYGWAFDRDGIRTTGGVVDGIEIDIDGQVITRTNNSLFRPDVPANDPRVNTAFVGWLYNVDTTKLTDGEHEVVVYVWDGIAGHIRTEIGRKKFVVQNNTVIKQ